MTPRQRRFVEEYLIDLNGTQAARRAGFSERCANSYAWKLMHHPEVKAEIEAGLAERAQQNRISADLVLTELARIAFADLRDMVSWGPDGVVLNPSDELTSNAARAVAEVIETKSGRGGSLRVKLFDKRAALESLARHLGMTPPAGGAETGQSLPPLRVIVQEVPNQGKE